MCGTQLAQDRGIAGDSYFGEAYLPNDQRALFTETLVKFWGTSAGWRMLSSHMSLVGNELAVGLNIENLLARQVMFSVTYIVRLGPRGPALLV
jgi:hypothetical protein